jgi:hypothetical protein
MNDKSTEKIAETTTWPDLAIGLYDKLTGRGAEITYEFQELEILIRAALELTPSRPSGKSTAR